jgi:flavin-dependent dehydrogenase
VEVREGAALAGFTVEQGGVSVAVRGAAGPLRARVLVGADGAGSLVRKRLLGHAGSAEGRARPPIRLFRAEIASPGAASDAMLYDFTPMRDGLRGYLWVFPVPGNLINVGIMHYPAFRQGGPELIRQLRDGLAELGYTLPAKGTHGWPVWGYDPGAVVSAPRVLVVGDAAGIDALTGEGIAVAMEQAAIAGDHIARALTSREFGFAGYRKALRRATVGRELALDRWLARLLYQRRSGWKNWMSLVLYDPDVLEMYAARVAGSEVLADQKLRLYRALARHIWRIRGRRRALSDATAAQALLPA